MKRRIIAASVAILVAGLSAVLLLGYVANADRRAMAGMQTQQVLVITTAVPEGTKADQLGDYVAATELPARTVVDGAVTDLAQIAGQVSTTDLQPGEQILASRFADPSSLNKATTPSIPKGFSEVAVMLEPQRVVGADLAAGDKVGVFISLDGKGTHLTLHRVLVTRVQGITTAQTGTGEGTSATPQPVPEGSLIVTVAVSANDAEQLIHAAEYGRIWMSLQNDDSTNSDTRIVTEKNVHE